MASSAVRTELHHLALGRTHSPSSLGAFASLRTPSPCCPGGSWSFCPALQGMQGPGSSARTLFCPCFCTLHKVMGFSFPRKAELPEGRDFPVFAHNYFSSTFFSAWVVSAQTPWAVTRIVQGEVVAVQLRPPCCVGVCHTMVTRDLS